MHCLKQIITIILFTLSMNVLAEDIAIDTEYYVSGLSCETEFIAIEDNSSVDVTKLETIELPTLVVTCNLDDSIMVSLNEE